MLTRLRTLRHFLRGVCIQPTASLGEQPGGMWVSRNHEQEQPGEAQTRGA